MDNEGRLVLRNISCELFITDDVMNAYGFRKLGNHFIDRNSKKYQVIVTQDKLDKDAYQSVCTYVPDKELNQINDTTSITFLQRVNESNKYRIKNINVPLKTELFKDFIGMKTENVNPNSIAVCLLAYDYSDMLILSYDDISISGVIGGKRVFKDYDFSYTEFRESNYSDGYFEETKETEDIREESVQQEEVDHKETQEDETEISNYENYEDEDKSDELTFDDLNDLDD